MGIQESGYNYPNSVVTRTHQGDNDYAAKFRPEADVLLFQLKNLMSFQHLTQLKMERHFTDGTIIRAWSVVNQTTHVATDFVNIDVRKLSESNCVITFIDFPTAVPPMENPGEIAEGEVEGKDYFKTYYTLNLEDCPACSGIQWDFILEYKHPVESRHWIDPTTGESFPDDHTVYSLDHPAWGEIINHDQDNNGTYILWKAYTEAGSPFSRTGLAVPLLQASILAPEGNILCTQEVKFDVDCCLKDISLRNIKQPDRPGYSGLWWESESGTFPQNCVDQPFMFYGSMKMCEVPSEISISDLFIMACIPVNPVAFYVLPDLKGSCLPFEWTLTGPGIWTTGGFFNEIGYYGCAEIDCHQEITIQVKDRCNTTTTVHAKPCCEVAGTLSILYTSLLMSCGHSQELNNIGGCPPYTWSLSGGGTLEQWENASGTATYTAPATNVNCLDNPTITVTDCCGNSASISLAVNCYVGGYSLGMNDRDSIGNCLCWNCIIPYWPHNYCSMSSDYNSYRMRRWDCDGTLTYYCSTGSGGLHALPAECDKPYCSGFDYYPLDSMYCNAVELGGCLTDFHCGTNQCGSSGGNCSVLVDKRTIAMKEQGCCPLNPITGLPF